MLTGMNSRQAAEPRPRPARTAVTVFLYALGCPAIVFGAASDIAGYPIDGLPANGIFFAGVACVVIGGVRVSRDSRARKQATGRPRHGGPADRW
jgi:hypothetical protein